MGMGNKNRKKRPLTSLALERAECQEKALMLLQLILQLQFGVLRSRYKMDLVS